MTVRENNRTFTETIPTFPAFPTKGANYWPNVRIFLEIRRCSVVRHRKYKYERGRRRNGNKVLGETGQSRRRFFTCAQCIDCAQLSNAIGSTIFFSRLFSFFFFFSDRLTQLLRLRYTWNLCILKFRSTTRDPDWSRNLIFLLRENFYKIIVVFVAKYSVLFCPVFFPLREFYWRNIAKLNVV